MISEYFSAAGPRLSFKVAVSSPPGAKHAGFRKRENHAFEADETVWCKVLCKVPYVLEVKTKGFDRVPTGLRSSVPIFDFYINTITNVPQTVTGGACGYQPIL